MFSLCRPESSLTRDRIAEQSCIFGIHLRELLDKIEVPVLSSPPRGRRETRVSPSLPDLLAEFRTCPSVPVPLSASGRSRGRGRSRPHSTGVVASRCRVHRFLAQPRGFGYVSKVACREDERVRWRRFRSPETHRDPF